MTLSSAQIRFDHLRIGKQFLSGSLHDYFDGFAAIYNISVISYKLLMDKYKTTFQITQVFFTIFLENF